EDRRPGGGPDRPAPRRRAAGALSDPGRGAGAEASRRGRAAIDRRRGLGWRRAAREGHEAAQRSLPAGGPATAAERTGALVPRRRRRAEGVAEPRPAGPPRRRPRALG